MTEWQEHELRFSGTVDSKTDRKQIAAPNFESLVNAEFNKRGAVAQRSGLQDLGQAIYPASLGLGSITRGSGVTFHKDNLLCFDGRHGYAYSPILDKWTLKGAVGDIRVHSAPINNQDSTVGSSAVAYDSLHGYLAYIYTDIIGAKTYLTVVDTKTDTTITDGALVAASTVLGTVVKAVTVGANIFFAVVNNVSQIAIYRLDTSSATPTVPILVTTTADAALALSVTQGFDLTSFEDGITCYLAYRTSAVQIRTRAITIAGFGASVTQAVGASGPIAITHNTTSTRVFVSWADGVTKSVTYNAALVVTTAAATIGVINGANSLCSIGVSSNTYSVFENIPTLVSPLGFVCPALYKLDITDTGAYAVQNAPAIFNLQLGSKPFTMTYGATSVQYIVAHANQDASAGQPTATTAFRIGTSWGAYLISSVFNASAPPDTEIMTRANIGFQALTGTAITLGLGDVAVINSANKAIVATPYVVSTLSAAESWSTLSTSYEFFKPIRSYCQAGANTFIGGSQLMEYDGSNIVEHGFYINPDVRIAMSVLVGTFPTNYTLSIAVVYSWFDDLGNKHYSAPTLSPTIQTSAANRAIAVEVITCPTYKVGSKIEFYCTLNGGSIYYLIGTSSNPSNVQLIQKSLTTPPTGAELPLYTTGGIVPSSAIATADYIHEHNGRLFAIVNGRDLYYSKKWQVGFGISMTPAQSGPLPADSGDAIALESLDDNLAIFKASSIYLQGGDGPNNLGIGSFTGPQKVITDVGCEPASAGSVLRLPTGIMFKSFKGYHILTRDFTAQPLSEMDSIKNVTVTSSFLIPSKDNAIFTISNNQNWIIYNYVERRWGLGFGTGYGHIGVTRGISPSGLVPTIAFMDLSGIVRAEQPPVNGIFIDKTSSGVPSLPPITVTTGWINLAGIQGYERIRRFGIVMENAQESFFVSVYYDYSDIPVESFIFPAIASQGHREVRQRIARQRCEAIKFQLIYSPVGGLVISSMILELGVIPGIYRRNG